MAGQWEEVTDPVEIKKALGVDAANQLSGVGGKKTGRGGFSPQAQAFLNALSTQAQEAGETKRLYDQAEPAINKLHPGPYRGAFLDMAIPQENGGFFDKLGAFVIGGPARVLGAITPDEVDAYQNLKRLQSSRVLGEQILQKGPQTESDAARMQLTEISPGKSKAANKATIAAGRAKADRVRAKPTFYTAWANKYGLNGVDENGFTADQVWAQAADAITARVLGRSKTVFGALQEQHRGRTPGTIKIISRTKVK